MNFAKGILILLIIVITTLILFGFLLPFLISHKSYELPIIGIGITILYFPCVVYILYISIFKEKKPLTGKKEN